MDQQREKRAFSTRSTSPPKIGSSIPEDVLNVFSSTWQYDSDDQRRKKPKGVRDDYRNLSKKYKEQVRKNICKEVMDVFTKYNVNYVNDMMTIWFMFAKYYIGEEQRSEQEVAFETSLQDQLKSLPLHERNNLYRLMTHRISDGEDDFEVNEAMFKVAPFLAKRSRQLLITDKIGRKERHDKINLKFIEDFMHDICRCGLLCYDFSAYRNNMLFLIILSVE